MNLENTQLILVDGLIGTGKSSLARFLARQAALNQRPARWLLEHTRPHPTHAYRSLPNWQQPWLDTSPVRLIETSLAKWRQFANQLGGDPALTVSDGQILNGDFYRLFWMDCPVPDLLDFSRYICETIRGLSPAVIFLDHANPEAILQEISRARGADKVHFEVTWKNLSPYCQNRGLKGISGWAQMQLDFRQVCLRALEQSGFEILTLNADQGDYAGRAGQALEWLGLSQKSEPALRAALQRWYDRVYDKVM